MLRRLGLLVGVAASLASLSFGVQAILDVLHIPLQLTSGKGPGQVLFYLLMVGGLWLFVRYVWSPAGLPRSWRAYIEPENRQRLVRGFLIGAGVTLTASICGYLLLFVMGGASFDASAIARIDGKKLGEVIVAALVVPILVTTEEFIFRAIVYNYLRGGRRDDDTMVAAALLSALIFALAHGSQFHFGWFDDGKPQLFVGLFLLGILTALTYEMSGSLLPGMGLHVALIWTEVVRARTSVILLDQTKWWMGVHGDPRTAAYIWLLFILLIVAVVVGRRRLYALAAVEPGKRDLTQERRLTTPPAGATPFSPPVA